MHIESPGNALWLFGKLSKRSIGKTLLVIPVPEFTTDTGFPGETGGRIA
jgi:hypothetical protein